MREAADPIHTAGRQPPLPLPARLRWQPLRIGLVDLFHYDSEEFWFRDGHLLLRGNNGTGKSKVLSLTLPFLLDAQLRSSRIEPDGDPGKKMAWNLLMNSYDRRIGYAWIEFGRLDDSGAAHTLTLGAGLSAVAARSEVDSWFFMLEDRRIGRDLWLINAQNMALTRERLREAIEGNGQVFDTAAAYRRFIDERLFQLGTRRYEALMDTLIQLRQPQLSRRPDETALSNALTEALPPMSQDLLGDVAEALNQLEEDRRQLAEFQQLEQAVDRFDRRYRVYAGTLSRRQARDLRQAQTEFDNASRDRNETQAGLDRARIEEARAEEAHTQADRTLSGHRIRLETLQSDPTMQDANRLEAAERDADSRRNTVAVLERTRADAADRLRREDEAATECAERAAEAEKALADSRGECAGFADVAGLTRDYSANPLVAGIPAAVSGMAPADVETARSALSAVVAIRREQVGVVRKRLAGLADAEIVLGRRRHDQGDRQEAFEAAAERRGAADAAVEAEGRMLVEAWAAHFAGLRQLGCAAEAPLAALVDWVPNPTGDNPASQALQEAQQQASLRLAALQVELDHQRTAQEQEQTLLESERDALIAGKDAAPPVPYTRGEAARDGRPGAPLWQLIDFRDHVDEASRPGLEAALEASGLLDAWVAPDGTLDVAGFDSRLVARPAWPGASLADWLRADGPADGPVTAGVVERLLAGVACGDDDPAAAEAWVSPTGSFRLGTLAGAWAKPRAAYIGFAARAAARIRRLDEIARRLAELETESAALGRRFHQLAADRQQAEDEWRGAPSDQPLRQVHLAAATASREYEEARERLAEADAACRAAEQLVLAARRTLEQDAADLGLPAAADALDLVEAAVEHFRDAQYRLVQAVLEWRRASPDLERQLQRQAEARHDLGTCEQRLSAGRTEAREALERYEALRESVGMAVDTLRQRLAEAREAVSAGDTALRQAAEILRQAGEARAIADTKAVAAEATLAQRGEARTQAVARLQHFVASGLLSSALPEMDLPDLRLPWTIEPALNLARRAEQALAQIKDDDESWARVQRHTAEDLTELQRALGALGHQASAEPSDWGLVIHIVYQNRPQRPDQLALRLADEIAQRSELLTARERAVLENHLQAEIAAEVQRLLRAAETRVAAINRELDKRPTSTGVRYRLQWLPQGDGDGAPVGLDAARQRLLNTGADLWSAEDRRVVGTMLQQRIASERERAESGRGGDGGSLIDQLARALDYRRWHVFRVQRFQDGQWRKLSGPASSGERALGLTVPLFAAIASFYGQGSSPHAPRLMLLDEAFAGIDDTARAHCMGLIREFDLDFVLTSEREWACYAELPGVSICHLQRREGIDAVYVSRWTWDGRARRREDDPARRFAPA